MAGSFPFKYIAALMFGNGLSGMGANILKAILLLIIPQGEN